MRSGILVALFLVLLSVPLFAQSNDVAVWASSVKMQTTSTPDAEVKFSTGHGYGASYNHFWSHWLSTEFSYLTLRNNGHIEAGGQRILDLGRLNTKVASAIAQLHFAHRAAIDPYLGIGLAHVKSGDLSSSDLALTPAARVTIEKQWGLAANAGVNFNINHALGIAVDGKYVSYEPNSTSAAASQKLKLNPLILSAGVRFRF